MDDNLQSPLGNWVRQEADKRGWSLREIARRSKTAERPRGYTVTTIAGIVKGDNTTPDVCRGLAHAFGVTPEYVMQLAGILADRGEVLPEVRAWSDRLRAFTPEDRQRLVTMIAQLFDLAEQRPQRIPVSTESAG